jgi:hypothetical protein
MESRPKKPKKSGWRPTTMDITVAILTIALVAFGIRLHLERGAAAGQICKKPGQPHELIIKADAFNTDRLTINQCDTIRIINMGNEEYSLAFGVHEKHIQYPGFTMQSLRPNEYFTIDATQAGSYHMHDHLRDKAHVEIDIKALD